MDLTPFEAIVAVIGESPYAEMKGDITLPATLRHSDRYPEDRAVLQTVAKAHKPVVTVFVAGRPLFVNDLLNLSDAFVAAWLPGTEGGGVADMLFAASTARDFRGTLARPWPAVPCPRADAGKTVAPLFKPGYGLHYASRSELRQLPTYPAVHACAGAGTP